MVDGSWIARKCILGIYLPHCAKYGFPEWIILFWQIWISAILKPTAELFHVEFLCMGMFGHVSTWSVISWMDHIALGNSREKRCLSLVTLERTHGTHSCWRMLEAALFSCFASCSWFSSLFYSLYLLPSHPIDISVSISALWPEHALPCRKPINYLQVGDKIPSPVLWSQLKSNSIHWLGFGKRGKSHLEKWDWCFDSAFFQQRK